MTHRRLSRRGFLKRSASLLAGGLASTATGFPGWAESIGSSSPLPLRLDIPPDALAHLLQERIPAWLAEHHVPGLAAALIRGSEISWTGFSGLRSARTREPVGISTLFEGASLTKPLFATGVMTLVEEGRFDLDRPLAEYGGLEPGLDPALLDRMGKLTARIALMHRTGLPNWRSPGGLKFLHEPDSVWSYSGEGYVCLQRVIQAVTGQSMDDFLRKRVLTPLGLERTRLLWRGDEGVPCADPHDYKGEARPKMLWPEAVAASSIHTTPVEFARFMQMFLDPPPDGQAGAGSRILSRGALAEMLRPQTEIADPAVAGRVAWGLGWGLQRSGDGTAFWHWGSNRGFKSFCIGYPAQRIGVVVFTNADLGWKVHRALVPELIGGDSTALMWKI